MWCNGKSKKENYATKKRRIKQRWNGMRRIISLEGNAENALDLDIENFVQVS